MVAAEAVVMPRVRRCGGCDGREDGTVEAMLQWQKVSDMLIAASLLSIPLELLYFATRGALAPLRRALLQLGTFIVLCGVTHLINVLSYDHPGSRRVLLALTAAKLLGALASSTAAASLPVFFPRLLRLKVREAFLHAKARRLDRDLDAVRRREETTWRVVRALTHDTCVSADARTVLRTTVLQLAAALGLHNCAVWMPRRGACDGVLWLVHQLLPEDVEAPRALDSSTRVISILDPDVAAIMTGKDAKVLRPGSALEAASGGGLPPGGAAAAIRLPMLRVSNFDVGNTSELASCAILVLVLPPNDHHRSPAGWNNQDLEIVQAVAYQVAVALSQAVAMEESQLIRHKLAEQHGALLHVKDELVAATKARNAAHSVMRDTMRRPMHSVIGLLSVMQQEATTTMRPEQRLTIDAIARTSTLSATLMDDAMEMLSTTVAAVENRELALFSPHQVARRPFELRSLIRDAASAAGCLSRCRGLSFSHQLEANSLPKWVVGDDRRVFHLLLHMVDALLSRCCRHVAGLVLSFSVCNCNTIVGEDQDWILVQPNFSGGNQVFVKFQVGLTRSTESDPGSLPASCPLPCSADSGGTGRPSIAVCEKIVQMMNGKMWSASDAGGHGETMTLILRFQLQQSLSPRVPGSGTYRIEASSYWTIPQHHFNGLRILLADSDAMSLEVTRKLLERLDCQVLPVSSGVDCLSLLGSAEPSFQLVVLDLDAHSAGTAAMDIFEMALRIRELSSTCWLPVLVALATSGVDDSVRDMCRWAGVDGLIQKPITLPALGAQLQRVLQNKWPTD